MPGPEAALTDKEETRLERSRELQGASRTGDAVTPTLCPDPGVLERGSVKMGV